MSSGRPDSATPARERFGRYLDISDRASRSVGDLVHGFGEREESGSGDFVYLPRVAVFGQRGDGDIGDVVHVDERLRDVAGGKRDLALEYHAEELPFGEVLAEPAGANDGPLDLRTLDEQFALLRLFFSATRQKDQPPDPLLHGSLHQGVDCIRRPRDGEVGGVADVRGGNSVDRGAPGAFIPPVEGRLTAPRRDARRHTPASEPHPRRVYRSCPSRRERA